MPGIYVDLIVSSSQERYEIGIIIIILSIWQIRKRIQVNTANKRRERMDHYGAVILFDSHSNWVIFISFPFYR